MNHSTPGLPVHHQLPEFTQTHAHRVSDAIQPSHPLLSPSLPAPNPSQHQGLFQRVNSSHEVAKVLEFQHQSLQWTPRTYIPHNRDLQKGPQGESEAGERLESRKSSDLSCQILQWKWKSLSRCQTLCDPMDYTVHGILQARILEWVAFPFSRESSQPRDWTQVSGTAGGD